MIDEIIIQGTTAGAAGSATFTAYSDVPLNGYVERVRVRFLSGTPPATTDINIRDEADIADEKYVNRSDIAANFTMNPGVAHHAPTTGSAMSNTFKRYCVMGRQILTVSSCDPDVVVAAYIRYSTQ